MHAEGEEVHMEVMTRIKSGVGEESAVNNHVTTCACCSPFQDGNVQMILAPVCG